MYILLKTHFDHLELKMVIKLIPFIKQMYPFIRFDHQNNQSMNINLKEQLKLVLVTLVDTLK